MQVYLVVIVIMVLQLWLNFVADVCTFKFLHVSYWMVHVCNIIPYYQSQCGSCNFTVNVSLLRLADLAILNDRIDWTGFICNSFIGYEYIAKLQRIALQSTCLTWYLQKIWSFVPALIITFIYCTICWLLLYTVVGYLILGILPLKYCITSCIFFVLIKFVTLWSISIVTM